MSYGQETASPKKSEFAKWENEIKDLVKGDVTNPPAKGGMLFVGSSTIRMWTTLAEDFPGYAVINRGFGGSQIVDSTYFADRIIFPYAPKAIFLRAGGNDIHAGKKAAQVFKDYQEFVSAIHARLPETEIIYIGLAPTLARFSEIDEGNQLCKMVGEHVKKNPKLKFIDCSKMTLGGDGQPRADLFIEDKLHLNAAGYKLLAEAVRPYLPK